MYVCGFKGWVQEGVCIDIARGQAGFPVISSRQDGEIPCPPPMRQSNCRMGLEWTDILVSAIKAPTLSEHIFFYIIATSPHTLLVLLRLEYNSMYFPAG